MQLASGHLLISLCCTVSFSFTSLVNLPADISPKPLCASLPLLWLGSLQCWVPRNVTFVPSLFRSSKAVSLHYHCDKLPDFIPRQEHHSCGRKHKLCSRMLYDCPSACLPPSWSCCSVEPSLLKAGVHTVVFSHSYACQFLSSLMRF